MSTGATTSAPAPQPQATAAAASASSQSSPPPITSYVNPHAGLVKRFLALPPLVLGAIGYIFMLATAIVLKFTIAPDPAFVIAAAFTIVTSIAVAVVLFIDEKHTTQQKAGWMWLHLILWTAITFLPFGDFPKLSLAAVLLMGISETGYLAALSKEDNDKRDKDGKLLVSAFARPSAGILAAAMILFWLWSIPAVGGNITSWYRSASKSWASMNFSKEAADSKRRAEWERTAGQTTDFVPDALKGDDSSPSGKPGVMTVMNPDGSSTVMRNVESQEPNTVGRQIATLSGWKGPLQFTASSSISTNVTGEIDFNQPVCIIRGGSQGGDIIIDSCVPLTEGSFNGAWHQERSGASGTYTMSGASNNLSIELHVSSSSGWIKVGQISLVTSR